MTSILGAQLESCIQH